MIIYIVRYFRKIVMVIIAKPIREIRVIVLHVNKKKIQIH